MSAAADTIKKYQQTLKEIINNGDFTISQSSWLNLMPMLLDKQNCETIIDCANAQASVVESMIPLYRMIRGNVKSYNRIVEKYNRGKADSAFKCNSDFIKFRIEANIGDIENIYKYISLRGFHSVWVKNNIWDSNKKCTDIVLFVYAYSEDIGFITEFQIGHPLAFLTFHYDSLIRDGKISPTNDLWKIYPEARKIILHNGTLGRIIDLAQIVFGQNKELLRKISDALYAV